MKHSTSESSFLGQVKAYFSSELPNTEDLSVLRRMTIRERLLEKMTQGMSDQQVADLLDRQIASGKPTRGVVGYLTNVANDIGVFPKVLPRVAWRERVRAEFGLFTLSQNWWGFLTRAGAFAAVLIMVGSVALLSFVATPRETLAEVARIDTSSGIVKIRSADDVFYTTAKAGDVVHVGDIVRVESAATARIAFRDRSTLDLSEKTEITITNQKKELLALEDTRQVKVSVLSGSVSAKVSEAARSQAFAIETSKGTVEAKENAEVAVSVSSSGTTEVTTGNGNVSLTPTDGAISTGIAVGTRATLAESNQVVLEIVKSEPVIVAAIVKPTPKPAVVDDGFDALVVDLDILKTRSFDALILVENGDAVAASRGLVTFDATLSTIATRLKVKSGAVPAELITALKQKYSKHDLTTPVRDLEIVTLTREAIAAAVGQPLLRRGVPEFVLVANHRYAPPAELRKLFAVLTLRNFAMPEVAAFADSLGAIVTPGYAREFARVDRVAWVTNLLAGMGDEPVYLPALRDLLVSAPADLAPLFTAKITTLEKTLGEYVGQ